MKRRSKTGGKRVKKRRRKAVTSKSARRRGLPTIGQETEVARLARERDEALEQQTATSEVLRVISRSPTDVQPVFDMIAESAARLCEAQFCFVYRFDGQLLHFVAHRSLPAEVLEFIRGEFPAPPSRRSVPARAILERSFVQIPDVNADPDYALGGMAAVGGYRSAAGVPILRDGLPIGAIVVTRSQAGLLPDRQIELLKTFADQAVIAIENVRLFDAEQQRTRELSESLEQQTATADVLKVISSSPGELEPVFEAMLENAVRICGAKFGNLWLREGDNFRIGATHGAPPAFVDFLRSEPVFHPDPKLNLGQMVRTKKVFQTADVAAVTERRDKMRQALIDHAGARTLIGVPMLKNGEVVGAIGIYRQEVRPFSDKQIELVSNFAAQAVIAIENTRLLKELRESLQQQTATADVLKVISRSTFDLQAVLETLTESAARLCDAEMAAIARQKELAFYYATSYGFPTDYLEFVKSVPHPVGRGSVIGRTLIESKAVQISDVLADPEYAYLESQKKGGFRTLLGVPLLRGGSPIGVLLLGRSSVQPFTQKQIDLVTTFADQAVIAIENVRLFEDVQKRTQELSKSLEQQTATSEVLKVISSSPGELEPVFRTILDNATRICEAKFGHLFLSEGGDFRVVALRSVGTTYPDWLRQGSKLVPLDNPHGPLAQIARTKKIIHITDLAREQAYIEGNARMVALVESSGARTFLGVPMFKEETLLGIISIYRQEVRPFTDKQIELLTNFAAQAVIAIENTRLLNELRESLQQQTATADVLKVISRSKFDLQPVLDTLTKSAAQLCEADIAAIIRQKGDAYYWATSYGLAADSAEYIKMKVAIEPGRATIAGRVLQEGKTVHVPDVLEDREYAIHALNAQKMAGHRATLGVPLLREGSPIGVVLLMRRLPKPFSDKQIELVETFADQAVIAIENVRLFDEVQTRTRDLTESLQQQTATADVLKVISRSAFDLQTVLDALIESATRLCNADQGAITHEIGGVFFRAASYGYSLGLSDFIRNTPVQMDRGSIAGRALVEGRIVQIPDVKADPEYTFSPGLDLGDFRTALGVPMLREGVAIGVLALTRKEVRPFTGKQIELVTTFADQAAIAIENVRLFESVETRTRELAKSLENLRTAQDRLVQTEKLASLGQLTAGIAHEIKNPLNFVNNFSAISVELIDELRQALAGANLDNKLRAQISEIADMLQGNLDKVVQHGKRADSIVKNMLLHSRQGSQEHRPVDINGLVEESLNLAYHGARAEKQGFNITLERSLDPTAGEVDVFPQEITRVLLNLISNGFYAATKRKAHADDNGYEPTLAAATKNLGDSVEIRIRDNGTGIPPRGEREDIQSVLHDEARRRGHGTWPVNQPRHHRQATWRVY